MFKKSHGKRPFGNPRHENEDNIKHIFKKTGCEDVKLNEIAQARVQ
jgi:hypothetical protein